LRPLRAIAHAQRKLRFNPENLDGFRR